MIIINEPPCWLNLLESKRQNPDITWSISTKGSSLLMPNPYAIVNISNSTSTKTTFQAHYYTFGERIKPFSFDYVWLAPTFCFLEMVSFLKLIQWHAFFSDFFGNNIRVMRFCIIFTYLRNQAVPKIGNFYIQFTPHAPGY